MIKLLIFFRKPANADVFEDKFANHVQLINQMPNVRRTVVNRIVGAPRGEATYYLIHEIFFADMPAANYALNSPAGRAAGTDLIAFAQNTATLMFAEVWGEDAQVVAPAVVAPEPLKPAAGFDMSFAQYAPPKSEAEILATILENTPKPTAVTDLPEAALPTKPSLGET